MQRPDYDYGYKDRPLNTKRSNYNNYLDSCTVTGSDSNKTWVFDCTLTTLTKVWYLNRVLSSNKLYIPQDWTYIIFAKISYENWTNDERYVQVAKNGTWILNRYETPAQTFISIVETSWIVNLSKWDYLELDWIQWDSWATLDTDNTLQITKIS
jgi:hypothetical protein